MKFLLDTNVISEPMKPRPNAGVLAWLAEADEDGVIRARHTGGELPATRVRVACPGDGRVPSGWSAPSAARGCGRDGFRRRRPVWPGWAARSSHGTDSSLLPRRSMD